MYINDLYERMHRFLIHCRINYISKFISQKGSCCLKLYLIDERGDEIVCMIYDKISSKYFLILDDRNENAEGHGGELVKGKVYSF